MKFKKYQELAARTDAPLEKSYDMLHSVHMVMGMTTEVGELVDVFKKHLAYKKEIDMVNVKEEIGDLMWYIARFCSINDIDMSEVLKTNYEKLEARYPEKFSEIYAKERNLERERKILENGE